MRETSTRAAENGMSGSEDHGRIRELFDELSAALEARGVRGHVYLVAGGALITGCGHVYLVVGGALITGYGGDRTRKDVGVRIDEAKDEVLAAAKTVAERNGLDDNWLDIEAAQFVPRGDEVRAKTVYDSPGIVVTGASAEYLLAMKVFAAREPDLQDIKHLAGMLGIDEASDAIRICGRTQAG